MHKVSNKCCEFLKKKPGKNYEKETGKKAITGIMGDESWIRKNTFKGCFRSDRKFTPLWDLTEDLRNKIEKEFEIPVPSVYQYVNQTGCAGCPYGQHGKNKFEGTNIELSLCGEGQLKFFLNYFGESYKFKGYVYQPFIEGVL